MGVSGIGAFPGRWGSGRPAPAPAGSAPGVHLKHRSDIDGLRALAVLPILLFHAGVDALPGGFLGVDIFFVISGFLITSIIIRELETGQFSLLGFYHRRVVRIFPALFAMLAFVMAASCLLLLPTELEARAEEALATAVFASNIYFWRTANYFGGEAETIPFLHTWSLGVEEQFYIFFPLFLLLVRRLFNGSYRPWLLAVFFLSSACAAGSYWIDPEGAFYLLPARAWQLALGALIAIGAFPAASMRWRAILGWAGLALIAFGALFVQTSFMLPMPWSLPASVGAALCIAYGEHTAAHRLLALPVLRWFGAVSYSLYLWHWPIITFYRIETGLELDLVETIGLIAASIAAAAVSYYYVEQPFLRRYRTARPRLTVGVGIATLAAMVGATCYVAAQPFGWRQVSPELVRIAGYVEYPATPERAAQFREGVCFASGHNDNVDFTACAQLAPGKRNIALIGDSHAAQYSQALQERFAQDNVMQLTSSGCRIIINGEGPDRCQRLIRYVYGPFLARGGIDHAILAGRWRLSDLADLERTIALLRRRGIAVTVIGPGDEFEGDFPLLLARVLETGRVGDMERFRLDGQAEVDARAMETAERAGAVYYSVRARECSNGACAYLAPDRTPIHFDYGHVTHAGARFLLRDFPRL
jgi:peptidoglycan/LPS O-acetylase OafA/YrhL